MERIVKAEPAQMRVLTPEEEIEVTEFEKFLGEELVRIQIEIEDEYNSVGMWVSPNEEDFTPLGCDFNDWQEISVDFPLT